MIDESYTYTSTSSLAHCALAMWKFVAKNDCTTYVVPDGCCDFIISINNNSAPCWFITELSNSTYDVDSNSGDNMIGIRLRPGIEIDNHLLTTYLKTNNPLELFDSDRIDEFCELSQPLASILDCLASGVPSVKLAAQQLGISTRTLQRIVIAGTDRTPYYWLSLARIRRAARSLRLDDRLSEVAAKFSFADQSHLTREFRRWFGHSPSKFRTNFEMMSALKEAGYD